MTQIEQIKAEIERLKSQLVRGACASQIVMETACKEEAYNEVLAFIDSLPAQPKLMPLNIQSAGGGMSLTPPSYKLDVKPKEE